MTRAAAGVALLVVLAALAAGCGGDSGGDEAVEPATWAAGFCEALEAFTTGISESGSGLTGEGLPSSAEIREAIDAAAAAASTFADDLGELGRPDVASGEEISSALETAARDAGETFEAVKDDVATEIEDAGDVAAVADAIADAARTALTGIQEATNRLQELDVDGTLTGALEGAPACSNLGG